MTFPFDRQWSERQTLDSAKTSTQTTYDLTTRLLDFNDVGAGIGAATGAYELRGFTQGAQDFNGVREQLVSALALPNLGLLKGPMSDKDVLFVKQLATRLANPRLSEAETTRAIREAQTFLANKGAVSPQATGLTPPPAASQSPAREDYRTKYGY